MCLNRNYICIQLSINLHLCFNKNRLCYLSKYSKESNEVTLYSYKPLLFMKHFHLFYTKTEYQPYEILLLTLRLGEEI
jgi:hypothetical protein